MQVRHSLVCILSRNKRAFCVKCAHLKQNIRVIIQWRADRSGKANTREGSYYSKSRIKIDYSLQINSEHIFSCSKKRKSKEKGEAFRPYNTAPGVKYRGGSTVLWEYFLLRKEGDSQNKTACQGKNAVWKYWCKFSKHQQGSRSLDS